MTALQTADFNRFINQIRVKLPGASDRGIKAELFDVLDEFFRDGQCWIETLALNVLSGTVDYNITPSDEGKIIALAGIQDSNNNFVPALGVNLTTPGMDITLRDKTNTNTTYNVTVVKSVVMPTTTDAVPIAPEWVLSHYNLVIEDGILGRMMLQKNKPYSDPNLAAYHYRRFRNSIAEARMQALRRYTYGSQSWAYPGQFRISSQHGGISVGNETRFG